MNLAGSLEATTLGDLFGALHRERVSGVLELVEGWGVSGGRCHQVEFRDGRIVGVRSPLGAPPLGELLHASGLIDDECHRRIVAEGRENPGVTTGQLAAALGRVSPTDIRQALRTQRTKRLEALFRLVRAAIRFRVPKPSPVGYTLEPMSPLHFLNGRVRARDRAGSTSKPRPQAPSRDCERALATLGLASGASRDDVRRAFRRLAARLHPDVRRPATEDEQRRVASEFAQLSAAYHRLAG